MDKPNCSQRSHVSHHTRKDKLFFTLQQQAGVLFDIVFIHLPLVHKGKVKTHSATRHRPICIYNSLFLLVQILHIILQSKDSNRSTSLSPCFFLSSALFNYHNFIIAFKRFIFTYTQYTVHIRVYNRKTQVLILQNGHHLLGGGGSHLHSVS